MISCLICGSAIKPFMSFGRMPIANGFLAQSEFDGEYFFELKVASCSECGMFQLTEQPAREKMFNKNYAFFSGTSRNMAFHFQEFAEHVMERYLSTEDRFVVEIGSNDGIMLKNFADSGIRHLGIEPSANVAQVAIDKGINTVCKFFDEKCAKEIVKEYGRADAFLGANVMCHIPYLHSVIKGAKILIKPKGVIMFEDPYLGNVIENTTFDQIYDEHVFLFSVSSIKYIFERHGMELIDIEPQETHGGSMRYIISNKGERPVSDRVFKQLEKEKALGLDKLETYDAFRKNCERYRDNLISLLTSIKKSDKRIVGYAATSKSTTIINYCGITTDYIEFISDTTPIKQGKFSPGAHIPIKPYEEFRANYPDYALLFAYNHTKEIMIKEQDFVKLGGKWITYVPKVQIV